MNVAVVMGLLEALPIEAFLAPDGEPHATLPIKGAPYTWPVRHRDLRTHIIDLCYTHFNEVPGGSLLTSVVDLLAAGARASGIVWPVATRVGGAAGEIFIDLHDQRRRAVRISGGAWTVIDGKDVPLRFRSPRGMLPLPCPIAGGDVRELRPLLNLRDDEQWMMLVSWLVAALRPTGPYPILALHGEYGSAKSTITTLLRRLIDPSRPASRGEPRDERDLLIAAHHGWVVALDNLSRIAVWLPDALCRLSSGGGLGTRALFTDRDEQTFFAQCPIILNSIEEQGCRGDLQDRMVVLHLPSIPEERRLDEATFWERFDQVAPRVLGGLLTAVATAHRDVGKVRPERLPRMADFARFSMAAAPALGMSAGDFAAAYERSRLEANQLCLDGAPIADAVQRLLAEQGRFTGTATDLLQALGPLVQEPVRRQPDWPRTPRALSGLLRRIVPNLRLVGIDAQLDKREANPGRARLIELVLRQAADREEAR